ncbi:hypothetical protein GT370_05840 [Acidocella sp. MX-AZ03]|nr:hypothetical protein [Acidocella sp. MX-AZ03]WBO60328.1 hypothetical protein GT370_05840 [Acidocella sp. MX-AZ03]
METAWALNAQGLSKSFGRKVVEGLTLTIRPGNFTRCSAPMAPAKPRHCG